MIRPITLASPRNPSASGPHRRRSADRRRWLIAAACLLALGVQAAGRPPAHAGELRVTPAEVRLTGNFARAQMVVELTGDSSSPTDLTRQVEWSIADPSIATVSDSGRIVALKDGETVLKLKSSEYGEASVPVRVSGVVAQPQPGFQDAVGPILSKAGCNMGACHASQYGKGGFVLSVFGFDPDKDWNAIVRDRQQRRLSMLSPDQSLFLLKPTMQVPHGGSRRLQKDSVDYQILSAWIAAGATRPEAEPNKVVSLAVYPQNVLTSVEAGHQIRVDATYADGTVRDVTALALYDSLDDAVLQVSAEGYVETIGRGQAPVMVRFEGQAGLSTFVIPYRDSLEITGWQSQNFVDELALKKFQELRLAPSGLCDDATFLRRAFLDAVGTLPDVKTTEEFLASTDPDKRSQLIDRLLGHTGDPQLDIYNDAYAAYWTLKWSDLIRNTSGGGQLEQAMWALHNWIRESFRTNKPFDQFVRELVTAKGSIYMNGPANYFRINRSSTDLAESTAQLFLGVRLQCAKCHHHPFEKYSQQDYYGMAAFFSRVTTKNSQEFGLFGRESVVMVRSSGDERHPRTRQIVPPTPLEGEPVDHPLDRRIPLAEWLGSAENEQFAQSIVNRYVSYLLGRGLVEPVDDMRATNPPSNVELMNRLSRHLIESDFDIKALMSVIMKSRLYQLSSQPTPENASDRKFYAFFKAKRLPAEPLLDAVDQATATQTKFTKLPAGTRAIELPDAEYPNYFLNTFAKPKRASVCECERMPDENLAQALHTLNGDILAKKIADKSGRVAKLLAEKKSHEEIVSQLYLATLCRPPSAAELAASTEFLSQAASPQECYEDLLWALLNSKQFLFNR